MTAVRQIAENHLHGSMQWIWRHPDQGFQVQR